ncbi:MAG: DUF1549 and DUF1553 domain-containing protein [Planctomycetota bacterium]
MTRLTIWAGLWMMLLLAPFSLAEDGARWARLETYPDRVVLEGPFRSVQLLVTGVDGAGVGHDLTRALELVAEPPLVSVDDLGLVRPVQNGEGVLRGTIDGRAVTIPFTVSGLEDIPAPSFLRDVMPILARRGCNSGTCHGAAQGKNGFKLSLRGYDPLFDHRSLTDDHAGRRFNRAAPDRSLFLLKPTAEVPHVGGYVLEPDHPDYELLEAWVAAGVPYDDGTSRVASIRILPEEPALAQPDFDQQFAVWAQYEDGTERDVTAEAFLESSDTEVVKITGRAMVKAIRRGQAALLARYEGRYASLPVAVMGDRTGFAWESRPIYNDIDLFVDNKLQRVKTLPSELCSDADFLRRASLDLTGLVPTVGEVETFLADRRDSRIKRQELVDRLIGSPAFVEFWTNKWSDLLQVNRKFLGEDGAERLRDWIYEQVASNRPYDELASDILTASGSTYENPPAAYYKVLREPDVVMENTTQLFLGVRFNCNKCHDHPFERWTQNDHWQLAAWFGRVGRENVEGSKQMPLRGGNQPEDQPPTFEERIVDRDEGEVIHAGTGQVAPPEFPYTFADGVAESGTRRERLAAWLTHEENPYFATSFANRLWSYFFGIGLIEPVDDIRAGNPPTNPELLRYLTRQLVESGFDTRHVMRLIVSSRTYQHAFETNAWNEDDKTDFSHAYPRRLPAETLYDAIFRATGSTSHILGQRSGVRAVALLDPEAGGGGFLDLFGRPPRESACECERSSSVSLGQALNLVNGETLAAAIQDPENAIADLVRIESDSGHIAEELFIRFLGRRPDADERREFEAALDWRRSENVAALPPDQAKRLADRQAAWESTQRPAEWSPVTVRSARSEAGATLTVLDDGSILVSGENPERDTYHLVVQTDETRIRGVQLEVLPDESLPAKGPGRAENGNFVVHQIQVVALPDGLPIGSQAAELHAATADFSQEGWPVAEAIRANDRGWAVMPRFGEVHRAAFETKSDLGYPPGTLLAVKIIQNYGGRHTIGRFRLQVTGSERPIRISSLPEEVQAALRVPSESRTEAQSALVFRQFIGTDGEMRDALRMATAQDLAWALATSPAFLFNH